MNNPVARISDGNVQLIPWLGSGTNVVWKISCFGLKYLFSVAVSHLQMLKHSDWLIITSPPDMKVKS